MPKSSTDRYLGRARGSRTDPEKPETVPQKGEAVWSRTLSYRSLASKRWPSHGNEDVKKYCGKSIQPQRWVSLAEPGRDQPRWRRGRRGHF